MMFRRGHSSHLLEHLYQPCGQHPGVPRPNSPSLRYIGYPKVSCQSCRVGVSFARGLRPSSSRHDRLHIRRNGLVRENSKDDFVWDWITENLCQQPTKLVQERKLYPPASIEPAWTALRTRGVLYFIPAIRTKWRPKVMGNSGSVKTIRRPR